MQILRCWIVYNRSWPVVALPILLWLATTGRLIAYYDFYRPFDKPISHWSHGTPDSSETVIRPTSQLQKSRSFRYLIAMLVTRYERNHHKYDFHTCSSLPTHLFKRTIFFFPALIVYRIWRVNSEIGRGQLFRPNSPLTRVVIVLIESGLLYTSSVIVLFVLYLVGNNAIYGVSNAVSQKLFDLLILFILFNQLDYSNNRKSDSDPRKLLLTQNWRFVGHHLQFDNLKLGP